MKLKIDEELMGPLWQFIQDENVTDIKWNGSNLWINDLTKGRYMALDEKGEPLTLDNRWVMIFCSRIANFVNENFNISEPSLQAETSELRIQAVHSSVTGDNSIVLTIRKTPPVSRLANKNLAEIDYADPLVFKLLPCLMRAHCSIIVTGDVGAGKTELIKYLIKYIQDIEGITTVEDTLELRAKVLYPKKDICTLKVTDGYSNEQAIRDALRLMNKWLIIAESRGRDITRVIEGASTGCCALTSIHAENAWDIPDRIMNMVGENARDGFENDVFSFFNCAMKIKVTINETGIHRKIDQICFFDRTNKKNSTYIFYKDGHLTKEPIPDTILERILQNTNLKDFKDYEIPFLKSYMKEIDKSSRIETRLNKNGQN